MVFLLFSDLPDNIGISDSVLIVAIVDELMRFQGKAGQY